MSAIEKVTADLGWREAELASVKILLSRKDISDTQRNALLRAAWALLYAHYEGFVKTALTIFYDYAKHMVRDCGSLPIKTRLQALDKTLKLIRSLSSEELLLEMETFNANRLSIKPEFPEVDTKSNLWPNILEQLLEAADINVQSIDNHRIKLKTLVSRRNDIAHGKQDIIKEVAYYLTYEIVVYEVMYEIAFAIDSRLACAPYALP